MPRLKDGEGIAAFRPYGSTSLTTKTTNYNYRLAEEQFSQRKYGFIIFLVLLSFIPFGMFIMNAEGNFRKAQVKQMAAKRRERLDKEHGVDRQAL